MNEHRFILEKNSKKHFCPACDKKRFVRYIDTITGEYLPEGYGRCDREINCTYHLNPYNEGYSQMIREQENNSGEWKLTKPAAQKRATKLKPNQKPVSYIPFDVLEKTRKGYQQNTFIQNLLNHLSFPFKAKDIEKVISLYHLGTVNQGYRKGAITFPFIDINGKIRAIQAKQFDKRNHTTSTDFIHSIIEKHYIKINEPLPDWLQAYLQNEIKVSCLFGEHMLRKYPTNPVALVEAPKTAVIASMYFGFPDEGKEKFIWLAVYNLSSLTLEKCKVLQGRNNFLFPDLNGFEKWNLKANELSQLIPGTIFEVSDLLESKASKGDKMQGLDIADYLTQLDWQKFRTHELKPVTQVKPLSNQECKKTERFTDEPLKASPFSQPETLSPFEKSISMPIHTKYLNLGNIEDLEKFFETATLPTDPVKLNSFSTITDLPKFISGHLATLKANLDNETFQPYLERLQKLKTILIHF